MVSMFALRISLFAALAKGLLRRLAVKRKLEDARYRHRWRWRRGHSRTVGKQTEPQLEPATFAGIILPETGHSCCYARYSCNVVVKLVPEYHFLYILLPFCGNSLPRMTCFLGKLALALRHALL